MDGLNIALASLPELDTLPAAYGALASPLQITGATVFDIVIAAILSDV